MERGGGISGIVYSSVCMSGRRTVAEERERKKMEEQSRTEQNKAWGF
ncbi:uncharacterized protein G2W53_024684 [Senna tora]|uniref:Uncharacterized protein n=1 Tax=Senna tora TaxID=362788 RepID=A0A834WJG1_9FABA|nr:uncharacterized protein G2W53_024684 [Senna tora]